MPAQKLYISEFPQIELETENRFLKISSIKPIPNRMIFIGLLDVYSRSTAVLIVLSVVYTYSECTARNKQLPVQILNEWFSYEPVL